jgi:hypothetical protein
MALTVLSLAMAFGMAAATIHAVRVERRKEMFHRLRMASLKGSFYRGEGN